MPIFGKKIIFSNEAHFDLGGYVNKQNCRIWGTENPHAYIEKPTHLIRVSTVWCGFWSRGIIGPFSSIFLGIVIGPCWTNFCSHKLKRRILVSTGRRYVPHSRSYIISRIADVIWPPRSYGLTPLDYYLWDAVKDKCYADKPVTIDALKDNIREKPLMKCSCTQSIMCLKIGLIV